VSFAHGIWQGDFDMEPLKKSNAFSGPEGPVVLAILDGVGIGKEVEGDIVRQASTPALAALKERALFTQLQAHGTAVGLPSDDDMGNSEVGHNAIGCGRVFDQGASLVNKAIENRTLFDGEVWKDLIAHAKENDAALHFIGLLSDGNVHSHIDHLEGLLKEAKSEGVKTARVHALLDGRDVPPTSALEYVERLEAFLAECSGDGFDYAIASGGGRMKVTMDRYEADWSIVERGWRTHVKGEGPAFHSAKEAIESHRADKPGILDQDLPPFVIERDGEPVGPIRDGDSVILFNFRGDRAIELSRAFDEEDFAPFERDPNPDVLFAGMMQYDGDLKIPKKFLVTPPAIDRTLGEYLAASGVPQFAISETQKFGHVTYFFNGNRSGKFNPELETYLEIPSDRVPFEERPWMKAAEITDAVIDAMESGKHRFIRLNYPNGDMVGHTGVIQAVRIAVEAVDLCLERLIAAVEKARGILIVSADHGNADDMYERDKKTGEVKRHPETGKPKTKTAHSLNPVPALIYDPAGTAGLKLAEVEDPGISSLAATSLVCLGFEPPEGYTPSLVEVEG
jgi:2,3-bisphosphoglycerate-independent phosphoglycerate mutase